MTVALPIKKQISLHWMGRTVTLDVSQELFSSHQVDRGSKMLLSSLEGVDMPARGAAVDFGCGYGVLGLAWQVTHPAWSMCYVDRDALAVAFAQHNVATADPDLTERASFVHDVTPPLPPERGFDLVLWNVPGKAGQDVLVSLLDIVLDGLALNGLAALVVVNPLGDALRLGAARSDVAIEHDTMGRDHTILHIRKVGGDVSCRNAFDTGAFDRPLATFSLEGESWQLVPVVGLPEYDSLSHSTALAGRLLIELAREARPWRWMVNGSGVGHLAILATRLWPESAGVVTGRDALALRATERAVETNSDEVNAEYRGSWRIEEKREPPAHADVLIAVIPAQIQMDGMDEMIRGIERCVAPAGMAVLHGKSTEIARVERQLKRRPAWRVGGGVKRRGEAAISVSYKI